MGIFRKAGNSFGKADFCCSVVGMPVPRFITNVAIEPIFNVGLSLSHAVDGKFAAGTDSEYSFESCLVATAVMDPTSADKSAAVDGAFSPKLRHNLTCQIGGIHQMTGLGMTAGWTIMNMSFNGQYMHQLIFGIPIFPNVAMFLAGLLIIVLFFLCVAACSALLSGNLYPTGNESGYAATDAAGLAVSRSGNWKNMDDFPRWQKKYPGNYRSGNPEYFGYCNGRNFHGVFGIVLERGIRQMAGGQRITDSIGTK